MLLISDSSVTRTRILYPASQNDKRERGRTENKSERNGGQKKRKRREGWIMKNFQLSAPLSCCSSTCDVSHTVDGGPLRNASFVKIAVDEKTFSPSIYCKY